MNNFFPININLKNKLCVVVGAGNVAERKIIKLLDYSPKIKVIAREIKSVKLFELINSGRIDFIKNGFRFKFVKEAFLVITATNDHKLNDKISKKLIKKNRLVNNVSGTGNVTFSAIFRNDNITISVSTNGEDPKIAKYVRDKIKENYNEFLY